MLLRDHEQEAREQSGRKRWLICGRRKAVPRPQRGDKAWRGIPDGILEAAIDEDDYDWCLSDVSVDIGRGLFLGVRTLPSPA